MTRVLNVAQRYPEEGYPDDVRVQHVPMVDGQRNPYDAFEYATDTLLDLLAGDETVFAHCAAGASRSVSVTAAALAVRDDLAVVDAIEHVADRRPVASPHPHLRQQAEYYVQTHE